MEGISKCNLSLSFTTAVSSHHCSRGSIAFDSSYINLILQKVNLASCVKTKPKYLNLTPNDSIPGGLNQDKLRIKDAFCECQPRAHRASYVRYAVNCGAGNTLKFALRRQSRHFRRSHSTKIA